MRTASIVLVIANIVEVGSQLSTLVQQLMPLSSTVMPLCTQTLCELSDSGDDCMPTLCDRSDSGDDCMPTLLTGLSDSDDDCAPTLVDDTPPPTPMLSESSEGDADVVPMQVVPERLCAKTRTMKRRIKWSKNRIAPCIPTLT